MSEAKRTAAPSALLSSLVQVKRGPVEQVRTLANGLYQFQLDLLTSNYHRGTSEGEPSVYETLIEDFLSLPHDLPRCEAVPLEVKVLCDHYISRIGTLDTYLEYRDKVFPRLKAEPIRYRHAAQLLAYQLRFLFSMPKCLQRLLPSTSDHIEIEDAYLLFLHIQMPPPLLSTLWPYFVVNDATENWQDNPLIGEPRKARSADVLQVASTVEWLEPALYRGEAEFLYRWLVEATDGDHWPETGHKPRQKLHHLLCAEGGSRDVLHSDSFRAFVQELRDKRDTVTATALDDEDEDSEDEFDF